MAETPYDEGFFTAQVDGSRSSAEVVVPLVLDLVAPSSVVDVGCGLGPWLATFMAHGVTDVLGIDGDHVDPANLEIPVAIFRSHDLRRPLRLGRHFDLAVSLEVAEHMPARSGDVLVDTLTRLAPVILFSAAVPGQGGTDHVNEQWPAYWIDRFAHRGYVAVDAIRPRVWDDDRVEWWYAQNTLLFVRPDQARRTPAALAAQAPAWHPSLAVVHPGMVGAVRSYAGMPEPVNPVPLEDLGVRALSRALAVAARRRLLRVLTRG